MRRVILAIKYKLNVIAQENNIQNINYKKKMKNVQKEKRDLG